MLQELVTLNVFAFLIIFARMGTALMVLPGYSAPYVLTQSRLLFAAAISFLLTPVLADVLPRAPSSPATLALLLAGEVAVGVFFGFIGRTIIGALHVAGTMIAYFSAMANAFIQDPVAEQQSSVFSGFLTNMGLVLVFATDMHHIMLNAVVDSYSLFVPGEPLLFGDFANLLTERLTEAFRLGAQFAAPLILTGLAYYITIGFMGRLMPALPVFFFGLPIQIMIQLWALMLTLSGTMMVFAAKFEEAFRPFLAH